MDIFSEFEETVRKTEASLSSEEKFENDMLSDILACGQTAYIQTLENGVVSRRRVNPEEFYRSTTQSEEPA